MVAASIDQLKREFTDKYVKVDADRPELARFRDVVGQVKTVNMSGRALVQFDDYHLNIGWYDIDLSCLTVVEKPTEEAKAAAKAAKEKPEGKAAPSSPAKQSADAAKPAVAGTKAGGAKLSVAEMMAAARAAKGGGGAAATPPAPKAAKPAAPAAKPAAGAKPASGGKMSVAEMLAAARAGKAGETASASAPAAEEEAEEAAPAEAAAPAPAAKQAAGPVDRSSMSVADMIAYCRQHDGQ